MTHHNVNGRIVFESDSEDETEEEVVSQGFSPRKSQLQASARSLSHDYDNDDVEIIPPTPIGPVRSISGVSDGGRRASRLGLGLGLEMGDGQSSAATGNGSRRRVDGRDYTYSPVYVPGRQYDIGPDESLQKFLLSSKPPSSSSSHPRTTSNPTPSASLSSHPRTRSVPSAFSSKPKPLTSPKTLSSTNRYLYVGPHTSSSSSTPAVQPSSSSHPPIQKQDKGKGKALPSPSKSRSEAPPKPSTLKEIEMIDLTQDTPEPKRKVRKVPAKPSHRARSITGFEEMEEDIEEDSKPTNSKSLSTRLAGLSVEKIRLPRRSDEEMIEKLLDEGYGGYSEMRREYEEYPDRRGIDDRGIGRGGAMDTEDESCDSNGSGLGRKRKRSLGGGSGESLRAAGGAGKIPHRGGSGSGSSLDVGRKSKRGIGVDRAGKGDRPSSSSSFSRPNFGRSVAPIGSLSDFVPPDELSTRRRPSLVIVGSPEEEVIDLTVPSPTTSRSQKGGETFDDALRRHVPVDEEDGPGGRRTSKDSRRVEG
ncbi:hypothetical protein HK097_003681, partial [Rhizophlyctis rosea]